MGKLFNTFGMDLRDTLTPMVSDDRNARLFAEIVQLGIRMDELNKMLEAWDEGRLDFTPKGEKEIYREQLCIMINYFKILSKRASLEGMTIVEALQKL